MNEFPSLASCDNVCLIIKVARAKRHLMYGRGQDQLLRFIFKVPNWKLILQDSIKIESNK